MKSIDTELQRVIGTCMGYRSPCGVCRTGLILAHVSQLAEYLAIVFLMPGHQ